MKKQISIADSELPIMKVLWENGEMTSPELLSKLSGNKNTLKTLLKRLTEKGAVGINEIGKRAYSYFPVISEEAYINKERKGFLQRVFDGSKEKMLLNFVKEEKITRKDLEDLMMMIEED